jgi:hypothetical protein
VALLVGSLGIVAGATEGAYHLVSGGFSGDDYSGVVLLLLAGGLLVSMGAVRVWKTRRLDERRRRRYVRRALVGSDRAAGKRP